MVTDQQTPEPTESPRSDAPFIRSYQPRDLADVYEICLRTADAGQDATGLYSDPDLMPNIFAGPYVFLEPELAFVVEAEGRAVGYVVGTADTAAFAAAYRERWLPRIADRYPLPSAPQNLEEHMVDLLHHPERMVQPELADYPAHLHIDLLPDYQGRGYGRQLIRTFLGALAERGVAQMYLSMVTRNTGAGAFYRRLGFREFTLSVPVPDLTYLVRSTTEPV
ncbi:GNAT family N-acetyltransferase [Allostreptomyces psammosilenae]|uniref:Ribosomal protein S18 acetylase RimI-like enzyme n=1 Tax=Allostreptomyces psammosilenae TaxID=1892865 RepID=A0A852ZXQ5_9ACTN|nr:GNAT family N-acetyltransferase [Allostreptomyces psammosilenae]NYI06815.1 ribosomal protein S18 acetylase RimI-like enzyme [Allostreptomyces psammosilenae]